MREPRPRPALRTYIMLVVLANAAIYGTQGCNALWDVSDLRFADSFDSDSGLDSSLDADRDAHLDVDADTDTGTDASSDATLDVDSGCSCQPGLVCNAQGLCVDDPLTITNFSPCSAQIPKRGGRSGNWTDFGTGAVVRQFGVSKPPGNLWLDTSCGAWLTGSGTVQASDFAGIDVQLNNGSTYSLAPYTGIRISVEAAQTVSFRVKMQNGNTFRYLIPGAAGTVAYNVAFSALTPSPSTPVGATLDLTQVADLQVLPVDPSSFAYAVHLLQLY